MIQFSKKLVAVLNEKIEHGVLMNALAHMSIGFGAVLGKEPLRLTNYIDMDGNAHSSISEKITSEVDLVYYGLILFGDWDTVSQLTKKFSLFK